MQNERYYVVGQIETAFFELLREKDYTDITVTDIIKKAQVSRGSFYRHYSSISEVMDRAISKGLERITDIPQPEKYRLSARNGVINGILMKWIADGRKETAEEIVNCIMEYVLKL